MIRAKNEIKNVLYDTVRELPITLEEIRIKLEKDDFIIKMKKQISFKEKNEQMNITRSNTFSLCNNLLIYAERIAMPALLQKFMWKEFHEGDPGISRIKS